jgi:hypothetical protein
MCGSTAGAAPIGRSSSRPSQTRCRGLPVALRPSMHELVLPDSAGRPDFYGLHRGWRSAGAQLAVFAFDLLHRDGKDLRALPLMERRRQLTRLVARSDVPCLYLVDTFEDGGALCGATHGAGLQRRLHRAARWSIWPTPADQFRLPCALERRPTG